MLYIMTSMAPSSAMTLTPVLTPLLTGAVVEGVVEVDEGLLGIVVLLKPLG
jgi:hypothetical protein